MSSGSEVWEWLEKVRGLSAERCQEAGLRPGGHPKFGPGVVMPYRRASGEPYAHKFRPVGEKTFRWHPTDVSHGLFNLDEVANPALRDQPVVICEGEFDALSCIEAGFVRSCSIPDGWSEGADAADGAKMRPVVEAEDHLRAAPAIIVAADADPVGEAFARAMAALFDPQPVRIARWPEGCKDANDVLRMHGAGELARCLNAAEPVMPPGGAVTGFSDLPPLSQRRILRPGIDPFDRCLAFEECAMSVCTGVPGHGKSTFVRFIAHHLVRNENIRVGAMELEGSPAKIRDHLARLNAGRPWEDMGDGDRRQLEVALDAHWRIAHRAPSGDVAENLEWLRQRLHHMAVRERCKFIYLDPWNELEHMPEPGESMTNYINFATKSIRQWAERYDTHVCVVAHPKKIAAGDMPNGYDIADSAAWANKPALGFTVFQDERDDDPHVKIAVWKVRDVEAYGFGRAVWKVDFDPNAMVYRRRFRQEARA